LAFKNKSLISVIEDVVESIRVKGVYTSTFDGTYTTCTTVNEFKPREVIFINGKAYSIIEATVSYFTVKGNVTAYNSFTSGLPYFLYGHILEISNILKEKNKGIGTLKWQKGLIFFRHKRTRRQNRNSLGVLARTRCLPQIL